MESSGVVNFRHRQSPSSERFLGVFSPPQTRTTIFTTGDELNEDDVFWTDHSHEPNRRSTSPSNVSVDHQNYQNHRQFRIPEKFGILAVLPEDNLEPKCSVLCRKPSISPSSTASFSRAIPAILKGPKSSFQRDFNFSQSEQGRKFQQSLPMNVPMLQKKIRNDALAGLDVDVEEDEMFPPHEIVARGSARSPKTTFSVLEGVGRTLKGRDLRQVRNAVWRKTGFLD